MFFLSLFTLTLIINAYNLVDGINGLAGSLGMLSSIVLGIFFLIRGEVFWALIAFNLAASIFAFLQFNFGKASIFMGDNGSTFIGLTIGVLAFQLLNSSPGIVPNLPLVLSIIAVPVFDLLRVFATRISKGKTPFAGDRTHIHHYALSLTGSPVKACLAILTFNLALIGTVLIVGNLIPITLTVALIAFSTWGFALSMKAISQNNSQVINTKNSIQLTSK